MRRTTHQRTARTRAGRISGYTQEDSWVDYSEGQGMIYSTREPDPIELGIVKLERDADLGIDSPYELYVVVRVKKRNDWGNITQFEIWRHHEQVSPYGLEDAKRFYNRLLRGGRLTS